MQRPAHRPQASPVFDRRPRVQLELVVPEDGEAPVVVRLKGELDYADIGTVNDELAPVVAPADRDVTIDLADLSFIDVRGLNLLADTARTLSAGGRMLRLRAPSAVLVRMLEATGLDERMEVLDPPEP